MCFCNAGGGDLSDSAYVTGIQGKELHGATEGILALKQAWPSAIRTVKGDHKRFEETYFATFPVSHPSVTCLTPSPCLKIF